MAETRKIFDSTQRSRCTLHHSPMMVPRPPEENEVALERYTRNLRHGGPTLFSVLNSDNQLRDIWEFTLASNARPELDQAGREAFLSNARNKSADAIADLGQTYHEEPLYHVTDVLEMNDLKLLEAEILFANKDFPALLGPADPEQRPHTASSLRMKWRVDSRASFATATIEPTSLDKIAYYINHNPNAGGFGRSLRHSS